MFAQLSNRVRGILTCLLSISVLSSCAENIAHHDKKPTDDNCVSNVDTKLCTESFVQNYQNHSIVIPEYSERGNSFNDEHLVQILEHLKGKTEGNGIAMIVFVHGWKHNSNEGDSNLTDFKKVISEIARKSRRNLFNIGDRHLVGVYVGWRGKTLKVDYLKELTYWERKATAEQFGNTGLGRLLLDLDAINRSHSKNLMVTIGHSLGGAAVLSAVSKPLLTQLLGGVADENHCSSERCGIGNGVFLINPAIEANQILPLLEATIDRDFPEWQPPLLVNISSEADWANKIMFPLGQTVGLVATSHQTALERDYYKLYGGNDTDKFLLREESLDSTTVANFAPFLTHRLELGERPAVCEERSGTDIFSPVDVGREPLKYCWDYDDDRGGFYESPAICGPKRFPKGFDTTPNNAHVKRTGNYNPLYFIRTDKAFMSGHNDIFNPYVIAFLAAQLNHGIEWNKRPDLYHSPAEFKKQFEKFLGFSCKLRLEGEG